MVFNDQLARQKTSTAYAVEGSIPVLGLTFSALPMQKGPEQCPGLIVLSTER
jgi:hypothetical protein